MVFNRGLGPRAGREVHACSPRLGPWPTPLLAGPSLDGFDRAGRLWVIALFAIGGLVLGALFPLFAGWAADLPWLPFQGPLDLLGSFDQPWLAWGRPTLGLVAGLGLAIWVMFDSPVLDIDHGEIQVRRRGQVDRVVARSTVDSVFRRGSDIVIETENGRTIAPRNPNARRSPRATLCSPPDSQTSVTTRVDKAVTRTIT